MKKKYLSANTFNKIDELAKNFLKDLHSIRLISREKEVFDLLVREKKKVRIKFSEFCSGRDLDQQDIGYVFDIKAEEIKDSIYQDIEKQYTMRCESLKEKFKQIAIIINNEV